MAARSLQGKAARFDRRLAPRKLFVSFLEVVLNALEAQTRFCPSLQLQVIRRVCGLRGLAFVN